MVGTGSVADLGLQERLTSVADLLVAESAIEMTSSDGEVVVVWTIDSTAATIRASAPRLAVRVGMVLSCRLLIAGEPYTASVRVAHAEARSAQRASLALKVVEARPDERRRRSERYSVSINAALTALVCDRVVPGEELSATIDDLSERGFGFHVVDRRLKVGDILHLSARSFEGQIDVEVTTRSVRQADAARLQVGGTLRSPSAESLAVLRAIIDRISSRGVRTTPDVRSRLGQSESVESRPVGNQTGSTVLQPAWGRT